MSWALLYNVNFSALANQNMAIGANVISGRTWYAKGNLINGGNTYTINLVNGAGLSIRTLNTGATTLGSNGALAYPHWFLPFSEIPGYDSARPIIVMSRFNYDVNFCYGVIGICSSTNDGTGLTAGDRQYDHFVGPDGSLATSVLLITKNAANSPVVLLNKRAGTSLRNQCLVGIHTQLTEIAAVDYKGSQNLVSGMPSDTSGFQANTSSSSADTFLYPSARPNPGVFFGIQQQLGSAHGAYMEQLSIFQYENTGSAASPSPKRFDGGYWSG